VQFSSSVMLRHAIQHSAISADGQMNASMTCQSQNVIEECFAFIFPKLQMGGSKKNTLFGHCSALVESTLRKIFVSPGVGEDPANTCWRDSNFCSTCYACMFKDRFHLFLVVFIHWRYWCCTVRGIICLFLLIPNGIHPSVNSFI
jgi:hypothetical protein